MTSPNAANSTAGSNLSNYPQGTLGATTRSGTKEGNMTRAQLKKEYFDHNYDYLTGVRIASTLGGFFALVLLILLYKSKCKKNSCASTPVIPVDVSLIGHHSAQTVTNGFVNGDEEDDQLSMSLTLIDSPYMNKINKKNFMSPAVLLTAANSESSEDEDNLSLSGSRAEVRALHHGGIHYPQLPPKSQKNLQSNVHLNPACSSNFLNPSTLSPPLSSGKKKRLQQNIDINVILPTPTISPSGSENFCTRVHKEPVSGTPDGSIPIPVPMVRSRVYERDRSRANSFGADSNSNHSYSCSYNGNGGGTNPLFFLDNLKYVDDTSSENIPTRASDFEDQDQDTRSIGSDSVFAYFEHNFDHVAPICSSEGASVSGLTVASVSNGKRRVSVMSGSGTEDDDCECRVVLTQAQAQVHHRESFCSELESLNDYLEGRRRSSSTQTTMSDLRQCLSISSATSPPNFQPSSQIPSPVSHSSGGGKSPPKPFHSPPTLSVAPPTSVFGSNVLTVIYKDKDDSPPSSSANPNNNNSTLLAVNRHAPPTKAKKRNFPALKKTYSLQCDETILATNQNHPLSLNPNPNLASAANAPLFQLSPPPTPTTPVNSDNEKDSN